MRLEARRSPRERGWIVAALAILATILWTGGARAELIRRHVLAIYDSEVERTPSDTMVHRRAEMPLNHLGYVVDYHDIRHPLPDAAAMQRYAAVVTWFTYDLPKPAAYLAWAGVNAQRGTPFIVIGGIGASPTPQNLRLFNRVLAPMGIAYTTAYVASTSGTQTAVLHAELVGYERSLDILLPGYPVIRRLRPDAPVALEVEAPVSERRARSALITAGPRGAFLPGGFNLYYDGVRDRVQWLVDPFLLFERILGAELAPVPDTTTVSGRRLYFSHIDGGGWNNDVEVERYSKPPLKAADVMLREFIEPYPDLPVSVGLVTSDVDPVLGLGEKAADAARRIYALPQVEVASHTRTHPFEWDFYQSYDRDAEENLMREMPASGETRSSLRNVGEAVGLAKETTAEEALRARYISGARRLPRAYLRDPFSIETEIGGAVRETEALAPAAKRLALYQWSGDARAFPEAIRATRELGLRNINGGGSRYDGNYPSVGYVVPIARVVGAERQIYAVDADETTFTKSWTERFNGYAELAETFARTESPRRLKGVNLHYHTYSAEKQASINAVRAHLEWARKASLAPIAASDYASIADGFFTTEIEEIAGLSWRVANRDGLQTVRFDRADAQEVDIAASMGVLGSTRHEGSLYIALDASVPEAVVSLRSRREAEPDLAGAGVVQLESARWKMKSLRRDRCSFAYDTTGFGAGDVEWRDLGPGTYRAVARRGGKVVWENVYTIGKDGRLVMAVSADAIGPLEISVECTSGANGDQT